MTASVLSIATQRLSISDWGPLLFPRYGSETLLAFYMDDSADQKQQQVFVVAGFLGNSQTWFEVERHWNERLDKDGLDYFRASDYNSMSGEFKNFTVRMGEAKGRDAADELVNDLKLVIKSSNLGAFCFMGPMEPYRSIQSTDLGEYVLEKSPYFKGHEQIIFQVAKSAGQNNMKGPVAFVMDEHMDAPEFLSNWGKFKSNHPVSAQWMGSLSVMDDKKCAQLQTADLIANTTKKAYQQRWSDPDAGLGALESWRKNLVWAGYWDEGYLTALVEASVDVATSPVPIPSRRLDEM